jgi:hypothetical protein
MKFEVYFQYGEEENQRDFLKDFDTLKEAQDYRHEQIELEGWNTDDPTDQSYAQQYKIVGPV